MSLSFQALMTSQCFSDPVTVSQDSSEKKKALQNDRGLDSLLDERITQEFINRDNPYLLTPYKPNYAVFSYIASPNSAPYESFVSEYGGLEKEELEFQLSIRFIVFESIFADNGELSFSFTTHAFWQAFNHKLSAPFRETNYEPELIFTLKNSRHIFGFTNVSNSMIINHQSNGKSGTLSRSWNRVMVASIFEKGNYVFAFKPWYRIPENKKTSPDDTRGDDNSDILDYLGYFEWVNVYKYKKNTFSMTFLNNLKTEKNRLTFDITYSFPLHGRLLVYAKVFNGWGRSLIDYDKKQQVFSVGFALNDWL